MEPVYSHTARAQAGLIPSGMFRKAALACAFAVGVGATAAISIHPAAAKVQSPHAAAELGDVNVNDGFAELVRLVRPAVVNISVTGTAKSGGGGSPYDFRNQTPELEEFFRRFFGERFKLPEGGNGQNRPYERKTTAVGSGFIIDPSGLVVTNNHVIDNADEIEVVFDDGTRVPATLKGSDEKTDLALLEISTDRDLPYVVFGDSDAAEVGDWVVAIGNPFGLGGTTTSGIISARGRDIRSGPLDDFIQIDASINRGNSGGPLFNTKGEVIGVNSAIFSPNGGSVGIGFAIPSSMAGNVIEQLRTSGTVERGFLGVHIQSITDEIADNLGLEDASGALVTEVLADTPAQRAGLEAGDVILEYDGKKLTEMRDLPKLVALTDLGKEVELKIWRNDQVQTIGVNIGSSATTEKLAAAEDDSTVSDLGIKLANLNTETASQYGIDEEKVGVIIVDVEPDSSAAQKGLRPGDIIKRVDRVDVKTAEEALDAITSSTEQHRESVLLLVERNNQARFVLVPVKA